MNNQDRKAVCRLRDVADRMVEQNRMQFENKSVLITGASSGIGRAAEPDEIAGTVLHLCSDAASFTNGSVVVVEGGQTAH